MRRSNNRRKQEKSLSQLHTELEELKRTSEAIKRERPSVEKMASSLRKELEKNNLGRRLYLQMIENRR